MGVEMLGKSGSRQPAQFLCFRHRGPEALRQEVVMPADRVIVGYPDRTVPVPADDELDTPAIRIEGAREQRVIRRRSRPGWPLGLAGAQQSLEESAHRAHFVDSLAAWRIIY